MLVTALKINSSQYVSVRKKKKETTKDMSVRVTIEKADGVERYWSFCWNVTGEPINESGILDGNWR